ncbi:MAG: DUF3943 domain-containing protein [Anaeromyxobacter sp.]|nr:DUF3943 domain-containing protein [Anaeromyxobacter sp.]MBL0277161.1 DUF3943 domain-containing protein [Anaeromyxobacter sp.]
MSQPAGRRAGPAARAALALGLLLALPAGPAHAQEPLAAGQSAPPATNRWRAATELGLVLLGGGLSYAVNPSPTGGDSTKLDGIRLDANPYRTNFVGHPLSGALSYQLARSNGLAAWEASLWSVAGSTVWEVIEVREPMSANDLVTTPTAGVAIGAPLGELSDWLAAQGGGRWSQAAAWLTGAPQRLHDRLDRRTAGGAGPGGALAAGLSGGLALARANRTWRPELRLVGGWELVRAEGWGKAGEGTQALLDASVSGFEVRGALRWPGGAADLAITSHVHLAALHGRALADGPAGPEGLEWLLGTGPAFLYRAHSWGLGGPLDRLSVVELPRLAATLRGSRGLAHLALAASAAPTFGGVRSLALALEPGAAPPDDLPTVHRAYGYHFAAGAAGQASLSGRWGPLSASLDGRADLLWGVLRPDARLAARPSVALFDRWLEWRGALTARPRPGLELGAGYEQRWRLGRADAVTRSAGERAFTLSAAWLR